MEIRQEALDSWGYVVWQEHNRTGLLDLYLQEILDDGVRDYNIFRRDDE